jgi:hypothetical protein
MRLLLVLLLASGAIAAERRPVIVELFTSEGCSSCPPADALLETLDRTQPVPGASIIALSEHVDYWNYEGWTDPYSSPAFSRRQEGYVKRFRLEDGYTPEMVIGGAVEAVGSEDAKIRSAVAKAASEETSPVSISDVTGGKVEISGTGPQGATVFVAIAEKSAVSHVLRGENGGRTLRHVAVVRSLTEAGRVGKDGTFHLQYALNSASNNKRIVAFIQDPAFGRIRGAASREISFGSR